MFKALARELNILAVIHRRAGKDIVSLQMIVLRALKRVGTHVYLFPYTVQARNVCWEGMDFTGKPFISNIPACLIAKKNDARMQLTLINGSRIIFCGSNNLDPIIGSNPVTLVYSEFALHHPLARQYLNPILIQNKGIEVIQSTPRGKNHLFELYETVKDNPAYHIEHLSIKETFKCDGSPIITDQMASQARKMGMSDEIFRQEFMCDFDVGNQGAYFTREMQDMDREGRITEVKPNRNIPVHTAWDLGGTDGTAGWLFQTDGQYIYLLRLLQDVGKGLKHYIDLADNIRNEWGCTFGMHFAPHDILQRSQGWSEAESRLLLARRAGWNFQVTPKLDIDDGIEAMRFIFPKIKIDKIGCALGIRAMREYQRHYNEKKAIFEPKPLHNWASHPMDALRYLSINYRRLFDTPQEPRPYQFQDQDQSQLGGSYWYS